MKKALAAFLGTGRRQLAYLAVGGLTTLVNYVLFSLLSGVLGLHYIPANILAWVGAVSFACRANARWVYGRERRLSWREVTAFFLSRLFSLGLETALLWVCVDLLGIPELWAKLGAAGVVVVVNYLTGLLVFRPEKGA